MSNLINEFEEIVSSLTVGTALFDHQGELIDRMRDELDALEKLNPRRRVKVLNEAKMEAGVNIRADIDEISEHNVDMLISRLFPPKEESQESEPIIIQELNDRELRPGTSLLSEVNLTVKHQILFLLKDLSSNRNESDSREFISLINPKYPLDNWGPSSQVWILWWQIQQHKLRLFEIEFNERREKGSLGNLKRTKTLPEQLIDEYKRDPEIRKVVEKFIDRSRNSIHDKDEKFFIAGKYKEIDREVEFVSPRTAAKRIQDDPYCVNSLKGDGKKAAINRIERVVKLYRELLDNNKLPPRKD
ncbi:hypothetical protein QA596_07895 [Balneolales bacterium ANBcel1]|nr:hypothetical protein [Balneolales bacterium ANBcel1]